MIEGALHQRRVCKPSGHEWLGDIPAQWRLARLRWLSRRYAGGTPDKRNDAFWTDGTIPWLNSGAVNQSTITVPSALITQDAYDSSSAKWIPEGALVMALAGQGKTKGMVAQLAITATCNQSMAAVLPSEEILSRFLFWWLNSNYQNIRNMAGGDDRDGLNLELLGDIVCPVPPLDEQTAVAAFLDCETAKIDALVEEQKRLIELLKEKRQAVISHAVTKGLDSDVPMKNTGVAWLGDVPEHWHVVPIKRAIEVRDGTHATPEYVEPMEGSFPLITSKDFEDTSICFEAAKHISAEDHREIVRRSNTQYGDVLMSMIGGNIGKAVIVRTNRGFSIKNVALFKTHTSEWMAKFLLYYLQSGLLDIQIALISRGGAQSFLGLGDLRNLVFFLMPATEMQRIVQELESTLAPIDRLLKEAEKCLTLMQERRTALISAAVSGKIDVRDLGSAREAAE